MKWFSTFQATIDRAPMTSPEKMVHLQSLLTGEAKALVDGYCCNGDLYVSAINRLQERFGKPKRIVNAILEKLSSLKAPNLAHTESYKQFSSFRLTMVDTFSHSTTNLNIALAKQSSHAPAMKSVNSCINARISSLFHRAFKETT